MTKGQEIAFFVYGNHNVDAKYELEKSIDAAIAAAVEKRTVECADVAGYEFTKHDHTGYSVCNAILALNTPARAYPFGCKCWTRLGEG